MTRRRHGRFIDVSKGKAVRNEKTDFISRAKTPFKDMGGR